MRASRLIPFGLVGGAALWALRKAGIAPVREPAQRVVDAVGRRTVGATTQPEADELMADSLARDTVEELVETEPVGSTIDDLAHGDSEVLVEAERELLTVPGEPGEGHRRRDQTAGVAAQEIAAAQVRARRNGSADA